jgi:hypothetical protein
MAALTGLAAYRSTVTELLIAGHAFGEIEGIIDHVEDLSADEKAALWLYAFSLRDASEMQLEAQAHLAAAR